MLEFKKPEISDKPWIDSCLVHANSMNCEYTFGNTFVWSDTYNNEVCHYKDFFICRWDYNGKKAYSLPLGEGDFTDAVNQIIADAKKHDDIPRIFGVTGSYIQMLQEAFTGKFSYKSSVDFSDYIYLTEKMASLSGKKYHSKRNHVTNFKKNNPDWTFEKLDSGNICECIALHKKWLSEKDDSDNEEYQDELNAVIKAFENYDELGFIGGLIRVNGVVVAYTMGEPQMSGKCFVSHFEKANAELQDAFAIINQEFTKNCLMDYEYVNREEDLGIEGLRKAKQSYHPEILLEKCMVYYND